MTPLEYEVARATFAQLATPTPRLRLAEEERMACLDDATATTGFDRHYVYHPAWAARVLTETRPARHVDISSTLHFCATVSAFVPVDFYDYRPAVLELHGLTSGAADLMALPFADRSLESISCMHTIEHIGLGRYGDPLDPNGDVKALAELQRVVAPGGSLLVVVPVGEPRIVFNAHRIYAYEHVLEALPELELAEFALIPEHAADGGLIRRADPALVRRERYACGCYWLRRPAAGTAKARRAPLASVVVAASGEPADDAVASALAQTYPELEVIVVTDREPAEEHAADPRVRILRVEGLDPAEARQAGVRHAAGDYVVCLGAGDSLSPLLVAECVDALERTPGASVAFGPRLGAELDYDTRGELDPAQLLRENAIGSTALFRRAAWEAAGGYDTGSADPDWDLWLACAERRHPAIRVPGALSFAAAAPTSREATAEVALAHPRLYDAAQLDWARRTLEGDDAGELPEPSTVPAADPLAGAHPFAAVAFAAELADDPRLLAAWNATFAAHEPVTLAVVGAVGPDGQASERFLAAATAAGILEGGADVLALPELDPPALAEVARRAELVYGRGEPPLVLRGVPRADETELPWIRGLATRRREGAAPPPRRGSTRPSTGR